MNPGPLTGWIPARLFQAEGDWLCRWLYVGQHRFDTPFFDETLAQCLHLPQNSNHYRSTTTLDGMADFADLVPTVVPSGFIFHVSRCGSTLLSQLLAQNHAHIVLSEVPFLDEMLRLPEQMPTLSAEQHERYIRAAIRLMGQSRIGTETHLFIKFDSWHIYFLPLLSRLFPNVPNILLYRSPEAVIESHRKHRGMHAVPGLLPAYLFGLKPQSLHLLDADAYTSDVLAYYYRQFLAFSGNPNTFLMAYRPDGNALMAELERYFALRFSDTEWQAIRARSGFHAKRPQQVFTEDAPAPHPPEYLSEALLGFNSLETKRVQLFYGAI